jgi:dinuclear metal center YbgI/SA1388 family protein
VKRDQPVRSPTAAEREIREERVSVSLPELTAYLDDFLRIDQIPDKSLNGLQVEGPSEVSRVALATDAALQTIELAHEGGAQLLIVHHGLFWGREPVPLVGPLGRRVRALLEADLGLYCAHLPLDAHPEVGNNAVLCRRLGLSRPRPFGTLGSDGDRPGAGASIGFGGELPRTMDPEALRAYCEERLGVSVQMLAFGVQSVRSLAIVSGGAADLAGEAAREGYDAYLTGETAHTAYHLAREAGINVLFAGHYATETWGVQALGAHLASRWGVEAFFCDAPTGF